MNNLIKDAYNFSKFMDQAVLVGIKEIVLTLPTSKTVVVDEFLINYCEGDSNIAYGLLTKNKAINHYYNSFVFRGMTVHYKS